MGGFSKAMQADIVNWIRGTPLREPPTGLKLALSTGTIQDDGTGFVEPADAGYTRQDITLGDPIHTEATGTTVRNSIPAVFGPATVPWTNVRAAAILDQDGNIIIKGNFFAPRSAPVGDTLSFGVGTLEFSVV